jgi:caffeoyl-CoA O-methyltransferase
MGPEMPGIVPDDIERYVESHTTAESEQLAAVAAETREHMSSSGMLTGHVEGRLLETLVHASGAKNVLEFGTFTGYSALAMAAALPSSGKVVTLEVDPERAQTARRHFGESRYGDRIELRLGPAVESVAELPGPFDLVFIDADKTGYPDYFEAALERLARRGLIVLDNMLRRGEVIEPAGGDESTQAIRALNERLAADPRVTAVLLPVRDGMTLVRRQAGT